MQKKYQRDGKALGETWAAMPAENRREMILDSVWQGIERIPRDELDLVTAYRQPDAYKYNAYWFIALWYSRSI